MSVSQSGDFEISRICAGVYRRVVRLNWLDLLTSWVTRSRFISFTASTFIRILREPKSALVKQYTALLETEGIKLSFTDDALEEIAKFAATVNDQTENIGARRLHTIMEKLLDEISFEGPDLKKKTVRIDAVYVENQLADIVKNQDLSRYIL